MKSYNIMYIIFINITRYVDKYIDMDVAHNFIAVI